MRFVEAYARLFRYVLPSPFSIALALTFITFLAALLFTMPPNTAVLDYSIQVAEYWESGLWGTGYLAFAVQMMLMLLLGHVIALSKPVNNLIGRFVKFCNSTSKAAFYITLFTILVALFNWGLGLIFGAIFARKVGDFAQHNKVDFHYPLIGAAGYSGLMVWHGGISGSALVKASDSGAIQKMLSGSDIVHLLPDHVGYGETVFSSLNISVTLLLILMLPLTMYWLGKLVKPEPISIKSDLEVKEESPNLIGAERLDYSTLFGSFFGGCLFVFVVCSAFAHPRANEFRFVNPNFINLMLFSIALLVHKSVRQFQNGVEQAISGVSGILLQFPLYFGILGIMAGTGMITTLTNFLVSNSSATTFPLYTLFSAGLVNLLVPSGGGQWVIQGAIVIEACQKLGVPLGKGILALAYGDQLTNMLQPFWALPLLGITQLKAREILPYTLIMMLIGLVIFTVALILF